MAQELLKDQAKTCRRDAQPNATVAERMQPPAVKTGGLITNLAAADKPPLQRGSTMLPPHGKETIQMKHSFRRLMTMAVTAALLLPSWALASGEAAGNLVVVADTRRVTGFLKYLSNLYNTDIWMYAVWAVVMTAALGCTLGFLMDFIMERTGLDLRSRKIIEH
jgi:hypothetical protein